MKYNKIHAPQVRCIGCPFRGPKVGSKGDPKSPIVFVAESPGAQEVKEGEPLIGPSGKIFHQFVPKNAGYILNAMECYPLPALKNEKSMNTAAGCCRDRLIEKVSAHPRRVIVAMGNAAVRSLTGNWGLKITQVRGKLIPSPLAEVGILPVVHVAALMRGGGSFRQWKQDIQYGVELGAGGSPHIHIPADVQIIPDDADAAYIKFLFDQLLWNSNELTCDIETTGLHHIHDSILSLGITPSNDPAISYCFYPKHLRLLKKYLESPHIRWTWHNGKFDIKFLARRGIRARVDDDTMLLSYALDEEGGVHSLEAVASDVLGAPDYKYMIKPWLPNKESSYELVPPQVLAEYQAIDTANTAQLLPILRARVRSDSSLEKLYTQTLIPASAMLAQVETNGICTDPQRLDENEVFFQGMRAEVAEEINELVGYSINAGSPQQVSELLYRRYKFPNRFKGSTDADALDWLQKKTEHPIFELILKHRKAVKMYGTYVKGLRVHVDPLTNRVHATFLLHGTRTGRLAARQPNMQNPPRLAQIRGTFVAAPGYELVEVDLSQAELRCLAALSGDFLLTEIYNTGGDIHDEMARFIFAGWSAEAEGAYEQRVKCKNVNFGIVYGITKFGLQGQIGGELEESSMMIDSWYKRFPEAAEFITRCRNAPQSNQVITTCFGRKKRVGLATRANLSFLMNEASNFPPQSISSDITLHAAMRTYKKLMSWDVRIVNLIHDAILMEVPITPANDIRDRAIRLVAGELRQVPIDWGIKSVPFLADASHGPRWGSLQKFKGPLYE